MKETKKVETKSKKTKATFSKEEQERADKVRNEGIESMKALKESNSEEIDLEIEAPGSANKVAEEGSLTI